VANQKYNEWNNADGTNQGVDSRDKVKHYTGRKKQFMIGNVYLFYLFISKT